MYKIILTQPDRWTTGKTTIIHPVEVHNYIKKKH